MYRYSVLVFRAGNGTVWACGLSTSGQTVHAGPAQLSLRKVELPKNTFISNVSASSTASFAVSGLHIVPFGFR